MNGDTHLAAVLAQLRQLNEPVPRPFRLPTEREVAAAESRLDVQFHPDYRQFLLTASDVVYGALEPALVIPRVGHLNLVKMAETAWEEMELPRELLPICEDNGDYYCFNAAGEIEYWSHNGATDEKWPDLATWIAMVWIAAE